MFFRTLFVFNSSLLVRRTYCANMGKVKKRYNNIIKSTEDTREYRGLELNNGMRVILVSDPSTDKSAAALCVNIGRCFFFFLYLF